MAPIAPSSLCSSSSGSQRYHLRPRREQSAHHQQIPRFRRSSVHGVGRRRASLPPSLRDTGYLRHDAVPQHHAHQPSTSLEPVASHRVSISPAPEPQHTTTADTTPSFSSGSENGNDQSTAETSPSPSYAAGEHTREPDFYPTDHEFSGDESPDDLHHEETLRDYPSWPPCTQSIREWVMGVRCPRCWSGDGAWGKCEDPQCPWWVPDLLPRK